MTLLALSLAVATPPLHAVVQSKSVVCGEVRVQVLAPGLVRIEKKGAKGFEDRPTFNVVSRDFSGAATRVSEKDGVTTIRTGRFIVKLPTNARNVADASVESPKGEVLYKGAASPLKSQFLPAPGKMPRAWALTDNPRMVPPKWGATPAPTDEPGSGWDRGNDALDLYVFVPEEYKELRKDFLKLTGPIEKPPLYVFGFIDSRYHPYTEAEALSVIDKYRQKRIPLDLFTVDTDWRVNGSHGYAVDTKYFPDMAGFLKKAHDRNVRIMFNDHPEPVTQDALDPVEMKYRYEGLTKLLSMGVDVWWFDRNWHTSIKEPMPGIAHEEWGQAVFHDMTLRFRPDQRPLIMTNFQGIDNGIRNYAPQAAGHRYPIWWTGDTHGTWAYLQRGLQNGVDMGVLALSPYVGEDLGGHMDRPSPELYVRFLQYGCLSPTTRVHCTRGLTRYPWEFGPEAERIVTDYVNLRYRLLPTLYSAAHRAYEDGTPLLRRCDIEWPKFTEAARNDQYLLGDDILVAPIVTSRLGDASPIPLENGKAEFFRGKDLSGTPLLTRADSKIDFDWGTGAPAPGMLNNNFTARWTGELVADKAGDYTLVTKSDDGVRLWIDGKLVIDQWVPQAGDEHGATLKFEAGSRHSVRLEYFEEGGEALVRLGWMPPKDGPVDRTTRQVWIPPGQWKSLLNGEVVQGPRMVSVDATLRECPMWARVGGLVTLAPEMQYTGQRPWDKLTVEAWAPARNEETQRLLVEDDGLSNDYGKGAVAKTTLRMTRRDKTIDVKIGGASGSYKGQPANRQWDLRLNVDPDQIEKVEVDGRQANWLVLAGSRPGDVPLKGGRSGVPDGKAVLIEIPSAKVGVGHTVTVRLR